MILIVPPRTWVILRTPNRWAPNVATIIRVVVVVVVRLTIPSQTMPVSILIPSPCIMAMVYLMTCIVIDRKSGRHDRLGARIGPLVVVSFFDGPGVGGNAA